MKLMLNGKEVSGMGHYVMAGDIKDATAEDSNVLSGKSYYNNNGKREGTMPNRGGMSAELAAGGSVSIPEGYHNGEGVVRAQDLASQTAGTAAAANIEAGYTAWVNGVEVEGSMEAIIPSKLKYQLLELDLSKGKTYIASTNGKPVMVNLYGCLFCSDGTVIIPPSSAYANVTVTFADAKITIYNGTGGSLSKAKFYIYYE